VQVAHQSGFSTLKSPGDIANSMEAVGLTRMIVAAPMSGWTDSTGQAIDIARELSASGRSTVLIDAMVEGDHVAIALDLPDAPGVHQMLSGDASFEDAVRRDPDSALHVISGTTEPGRVFGLDTQGLGPVLEALEAAYDIIIIYAAPAEASALVSIPSQAEPALVMIVDPSGSTDEALWLADDILTRADSPANVMLLAHSQTRPWAMPQMPFPRRAAAG
jgi:MinD-like ATPase involved in chromosome partitioning or flagellar assembly